MNQALIEFLIARLREEVDRLLDNAPVTEIKTITRGTTQVLGKRSRDGLDLAQQHELAMIEAMWSIVHVAAAYDPWHVDVGEGAQVLDRTLRHLGSIWSSHTEYRKEWRP
jgi:hypothetical protein